MNLMRYNTNHSISVLFEIEHTTKKILFNVFLQHGIWGSRMYVAGSQSKCDFKYNRQECIYIYILIKFSVTCVKVLSAVKTEKKKKTVAQTTISSLKISSSLLGLDLTSLKVLWL